MKRSFKVAHGKWGDALMLCVTVFLSVAATDFNPRLSGGGTTAFDVTRQAFSLSARNLSREHRASFYVGQSFFNENWLAAKASVSTRDGLGPMFVARACSACHVNDGRGAPPEADQTAEMMAVRISVPGQGAHGGPNPDPVYGLQLQTHALPGIPREAEVIVSYRSLLGTYGDGQPFYLRQPAFQITGLGYGPLNKRAVVSPLVAPAIFGLGLLEAVPDQTLLRQARMDQQRNDGISGQVNRVWDASAGQMRLGRFGWKAEQPSVRQQCAIAFNGDMGLTTSLCPDENNTATESDCTNSISGGMPEVSDKIFSAVVDYARLLAVPARRDVTNAVVQRGENLFHQLNCAVCHLPELTTGNVPGFPEVSHQVIHPYTDLLLHDMGAGLSDQRQVFQAGPRDWRTPPLWGIGLVGIVNSHNYFLHDGRARGLAEAILWHGGEAERSKEEFRCLSQEDRNALIRFLESL